MGDPSKALVRQPSTGLSPISRLAERTLAERAERQDATLVGARVLVVGPGGHATIGAAVDAARDGDSVLVRPGRYEESVVVRASRSRSEATAIATRSWSAGTTGLRSG